MTTIHRLLAACALAFAMPAVAAPALLRVPALEVPGGGGRALRVRVTAPEHGRRLPVLIFSHGATYSGDDYRALAEDWAADGWLVLQPTHLDARILGTPADDPRQPRVWHLRRDDMVGILDHLAQIERDVPALRGRIDATRIVAVGHSYGGHTTELLLGATTRDPQTGAREDLSDPRIRGGILLSAPGGWDGVTQEWTQKGPFLDVDWSTMRKPALVITGDLDDSPMSTRGPVWHEDPYRRAPAGAVCLVTLAHAGHFLGGIGHDGPPAAHDPHDAPSVETVHAATLAWLQHLIGNERPWRAELVRLRHAPTVHSAACR